MLKDVLTPKQRKLAYTALVLVGLALGAIQAGYLAVGLTAPLWHKAALAVYAYVSTAGFGLARGNVASESREDAS